MTNPQGAVQALITPANSPAWAVVDRIDEADDALAPFRAVSALTTMSRADSEQDMEQLRRNDLAALIDVLTNNVAGTLAQAREAARVQAQNTVEATSSTTH